ncbi:MAG: 5-bromo-4-chloroindolyl phosphate hydrolysis family protein, partial [Acidobacteriota bacterium]
ELRAGDALVGLAALTNLTFPILVGLSAAVYFGVRLAVPDRAAEMVAEGITRSQLETTMREIRSQAARFDHFGDRLRNPSRRQVRRIAQLTRDIIEHLKRDPSNLVVATEFLELHLPKALRIVETFTLLSEQKHLDDVGREHLAEAEKTIGMIEKAFAAQHTRMLESDVEAFDLDRRVYEELLRLDGQIDRWADDDFEAAGEEARRESAAGPGAPPLPPGRS